jgi:YhcH/YjgK/YiaL family protein
MVFDSCGNATFYTSLNKRFEKAFAYLAKTDLAPLEPGRYEIDGDEIYMMVMERELKKPEDAALEVHDQYIDIQVVVIGKESFGWRDRHTCAAPRGEMDTTKDILFYDDRATCTVTLTAGQFGIFFPGDAHAPLIGEGTVKKCVVKVKC